MSAGAAAAPGRPVPRPPVAARAGLPREALDRLAAAKLWLISPPASGGPPTGDMPYLAVALYALVPVATDAVARMATDTAWRLYVNPAWLADPTVDVPALGRELAHHTWHLLADHAGRAADLPVTAATSRAWRVATDVTIHEVLADLPGLPAGPAAAGPRGGPRTARSGASAALAGAGPRTPGHVLAARAAALGDRHDLLPPAALGLAPGRAAEEHYAVLSGLPVEPLAEEPLAVGPLAGDRGRGCEADAAHDDDPGIDPAWRPRAHPGDARPADRPDPSCGSGCDGIRRTHDLPEQADVGGLDVSGGEAIRRQVAIAFRESHGQGSVPGEWGRWVEQVLDPVVDWRTVLHAAVRRGMGWAHGHTDYTYTRISRRQAAAGPVILPALRRPVPRVAVVVDTSGSVDDGLLAQALGEIDGVLATLGVADPQVTVLAVDAAVHTVASVRRADAVRLAGGGGTDMGVGIAAAEALRPRVDVVVVCTDGYTDWPALPAAVPVVGVLIGRHPGELPGTPPWIHRVECVPG
jgi:predicted metal-dependent peptidase